MRCPGKAMREANALAQGRTFARAVILAICGALSTPWPSSCEPRPLRSLVAEWAGAVPKGRNGEEQLVKVSESANLSESGGTIYPIWLFFAMWQSVHYDLQILLLQRD
jgi:hypothetical protein